MIIETAVLERWYSRATQANKNILQNLLEFGEYYSGLEHGEKMQAYKEAAEANMMSAENFRYKFGLVLRFKDCNLCEWFANGISFDHLENSSAAEYKKMTPKELIEKAIELGGPDGKTMTVNEMLNFALGEKPDSGANKGEFRFFSNLLKFCNLRKWTPEQSERFQTGVRELIDKIESELK